MGVVWNSLLAAAGLAVAAGTVLEVRALRADRQQDTLTRHLRPWALRHKGAVLIVCGTLAAALAWLPGHLFGWW